MPLKKSGGPFVGLDIGTTSIKVCEVDIKGGKPNLRGIAVFPTPTDAVANNEIVDPVALGKLIKSALQQSGIKAKKAVSSVAGQSSLVVRIIEVPKMTRAELQETMKWEIERHVPFAAEQVVMDYQPLVSPEDVPDGQNMEVLLAVAQENLVTRHVEAIQAAGLQPLAVDIEALASSRSLLDLSNGSGPTGTVALIDIGASSTDISIYKEGRIAFTRSIQLAGNNITKAISDVLGRPLAEAEQLKLEYAGVPDMPQAPGGGMGDDPFGMPALDFGMGGPDLGAPLGGTFGMAAAPDTGTSTSTSTATDTHAEPDFDIAGGGFSADAFTTPAEGDAPAADPAADVGASPFGAPPPSGPVPAANPFDPGAGEEPSAPAAAPNPFGESLFGPTPGANPFAPPEDPAAPAAPAAPALDFNAPNFGAPSFGEPGFGEPGLGGAQLFDASAPAAPAAMSDDEYMKTQVADAVMPVLHEMVTEIQRSLDFYRNRANGLGAQQVVITGGTAKLRGIADFLAGNLDVPVMVGNPLQYLSAGPKSDPGYLQDVGPVFSVSVGLAVRELMMEPPAPRKKKTK